MAFDELGQALVQLIDLRGELFDALGEHAQRQVGGLGHRVLVSPTVVRGEACAGAEQLGIAQAGQLFPQGLVGDDQDGLELVDRLGTGLDRGVLGECVSTPRTTSRRTGGSILKEELCFLLVMVVHLPRRDVPSSRHWPGRSEL
ncbi:hypothetical protein ABTX60_40900 [Streptomyces sp. NPDC126510]|uniref:hypothetical protein n=1 Tax=Streptomyces sp. NPDC126510 TaxID=3155317 RepID=UPI0033267639